MKMTWAWRWLGGVGLIGAVVLGCESTPTANQDGAQRTTRPGQTVEPQWLMAKWDLDGERTHKANDTPGILAVPSDVYQDVLGMGFSLKPGGVADFDPIIGTGRGRWEVRGDKLTLVDPDGEKTTWKIHFEDGCLYCKTGEKTWKVFAAHTFFES